MSYYVKLDENSIIRDIISFPYDGFVQIEINEPLPNGIGSGYYKWTDGALEVDPVLKDELDKQEGGEIEALKDRLELTEIAIDFIIMNGGV